MKKVMILVIFTVLFFAVSCGDSEKNFDLHDDESSNDDTSDSQSENGSGTVCTDGEFKCRNDKVSLSCMDGKWLAKECDTSEVCNTETGKWLSQVLSVKSEPPTNPS